MVHDLSAQVPAAGAQATAGCGSRERCRRTGRTGGETKQSSPVIGPRRPFPSASAASQVSLRHTALTPTYRTGACRQTPGKATAGDDGRRREAARGNRWQQPWAHAPRGPALRMRSGCVRTPSTEVLLASLCLRAWACGQQHTCCPTTRTSQGHHMTPLPHSHTRSHIKTHTSHPTRPHSDILRRGIP